MNDELKTIQIEVTLKNRWVKPLINMLQDMQRLGSIGASRELIFFADGDGDFRPKFKVNINIPESMGVNELSKSKKLFYDAYKY